MTLSVGGSRRQPPTSNEVDIQDVVESTERTRGLLKSKKMGVVWPRPETLLREGRRQR